MKKRNRRKVEDRCVCVWCAVSVYDDVITSTEAEKAFPGIHYSISFVSN